MNDERCTDGLKSDVSFRTGLTIDQVAALWRPLEEAARPSFFLSWSWVGCWLRQTGLPANLLLAHRNGNLVGLALLHAKRGGGFHLTSSGKAAFDSIFVEYNGFLAAPCHLPEVSLAFQAFLAGRRWGSLHLPGVAEAMNGLRHSERFSVTETIRPAPFVDLAELRRARRAYLESRSGNCRQQIRRSLRLFEGRGPVTLERASSLDEARQIFDQLKYLHQLSWRSRGRPGAFAVAFFERFHRALLDEAWPDNHIDLLRLRVGSTVVGCLYNFIEGGEVYAYQSGFTQDPDPRCKPGMVAHALAVEYYLGAGFDRYLLLAGDSRYKTSLSSGEDRLRWLVIRRAGWMTRAARAARSVFRRHQSIADGIADQAGDVVNIQSLHQAGAVRFDGLDA